MSILTELPASWYPDDAFQDFSDERSFAPGMASALMWLSQLAYEDSDSDKAKDIAHKWGVEAVPLEKPLAQGIELPLLTPKLGLSAQVFLKDKSLLVVFPGTDPLRLAHWLIDLDTRVRDDLHAGFQRAVEVVWPPLARAIEKETGRDPGLRLVFAGHSLGGALAILAANLTQKEGRDASAVYAFGVPRAGDAKFAEGYNGRLGHRTYRFVLGKDIIPTVPGALFDYRHVGLFLPSAAGRFEVGTFNAPRDASEAIGWSNEPAFRPEVYREFVDAAVRSDLLAKLAELVTLGLGALIEGRDENAVRVVNFLLKTPLRDHLPISYCRAFSAN
jgi:triacylglycerol lipase